MWRRVPCEQQLNMGQPVLRDAVKTVAKVLDVFHYAEGFGGVSRRGIGLIFPSLITEIVALVLQMR
jgi:hypothetical protein